MAVGDKNVTDFGDVSPQGVHCLGDPDCAAGHASVNESQTIRAGVEEEGIDPRQTYLMQSGLDLLNTHRDWLSWVQASSPADTASRLRCFRYLFPKLIATHLSPIENSDPSLERRLKEQERQAGQA
jgi:hypothetical protein